jgi:hypothetical protein
METDGRSSRIANEDKMTPQEAQRSLMGTGWFTNVEEPSGFCPVQLCATLSSGEEVSFRSRGRSASIEIRPPATWRNQSPYHRSKEIAAWPHAGYIGPRMVNDLLKEWLGDYLEACKQQPAPELISQDELERVQRAWSDVEAAMARSTAALETLTQEESPANEQAYETAKQAEEEAGLAYRRVFEEVHASQDQV